MIDRRRFVVGTGAGLAALLGDRGRLQASLTRLAPIRSASDAARLREEYMLTPGLLYLNHGSIGTIPRVVHDAHVRRLAECETNPHVHMWTDVWAEALAATRTAVSELVH